MSNHPAPVTSEAGKETLMPKPLEPIRIICNGLTGPETRHQPA